MGIETIQKKTDANRVVATALGLSARYVRAVIADKDKNVYKGKKPQRIRDLHAKYLLEKSNVINSIAQSN
jgi:hypothetical protein